MKKQRLLLLNEAVPAVQRVERTNCSAEGGHSEPIHVYHHAGDQHTALVSSSGFASTLASKYTRKIMDTIKGKMTEIYNYPPPRTPLGAQKLRFEG